jgi:hypothetical protein
MRKIASYIIYTILIACIACACSSDLDIKQGYEFKVTHLPVPKKIRKGETVEIRCQLEKSGYYANTAYRFRFFQFDGKGSLSMDGGAPFLPNDYYELTKESFSFYYTSGSEEQTAFDIYFFNSEGNSFTLSFAFNADNSQEEQR